MLVINRHIGPYWTAKGLADCRTYLIDFRAIPFTLVAEGDLVFYDSRYVELARELGIRSIPVIELPPDKSGVRAFERSGSRLRLNHLFWMERFPYDFRVWVTIKIPNCAQPSMKNIPIRVLSRKEALGILKPPE